MNHGERVVCENHLRIETVGSTQAGRSTIRYCSNTWAAALNPGWNPNPDFLQCVQQLMLHITPDPDEWEPPWCEVCNELESHTHTIDEVLPYAHYCFEPQEPHDSNH